MQINDYEASVDAYHSSGASRLKLDGGKVLISQNISILLGIVELVKTSYKFQLLGHSNIFQIRVI